MLCKIIIVLSFILATIVRSFTLPTKHILYALRWNGESKDHFRFERVELEVDQTVDFNFLCDNS